MKITELKNDKTEYHATITFPEKEVSALVTKELDTVAKTAKINGFRVGKVPAATIKTKYLSSVRADIARDKINTAIDEIIKNNKLNIAMDPAIENLINDEGKDLEFTVKFELLPEIKMPDFKKISIEKPRLEISAKDIDEQIDRLAGFSKSFDEESKAKAKDGDQVTIDAIGYVDGKAFDGGKLDAHKLVLGSKSFIPGFEDQLIGSKAGDDVTVSVEFPKEYHAADLAGKPSEFKVQVKAVHKAKAPVIDDEFAKKFKCETLDKLKEQISKNIEASYEDPTHTLMKMKLFDQLDSMMDFDIPASLLQREIHSLKHQTEQMDSKDSSKKDIDENLSKLATRRVKIGLTLAEYVKINTLEITEDDVRQAIVAQARNYPGQEREVFEFYQKDRNALESLKGPILEEKAVKAIFDKEVTIKEKSYSKEKLEALLDKEIRD
ncbi:MAG: trigger factor [Rickettsiaceae bacterium]|nr:trigger factor [Rickettsiaceae bacterium]